MTSQKMIHSWVDANIDSLFASYKKNPSSKFPYKPSCLDFIEERKKKEFRDYLLDVAESIVLKRRKKLHQSHVREIKVQNDASKNSFPVRENAINLSIERDFVYFRGKICMFKENQCEIAYFKEI